MDLYETGRQPTPFAMSQILVRAEPSEGSLL